MKLASKFAMTVVTALAASHVIAQDASALRSLATVGGQTITEAKVRFELGGAILPANLRPSAERAALEGIIARKLMVQEATRRKIDTTPSAAMMLKRADDLALVAVLERSLTKDLPPVADAEVAKFVADHPASFGKRKRIWVDQLQAPNVAPDLVRQMAALEQMEDISGLLDRAGTEYVRSAAVLDTLDMDPEAAAKLAGMPQDSVFITPKANGALEVSRIKNTQTVPVQGTAATDAARRYLKHARDAAVAQAAMAKIVKAGRATVRINPQYQ